MLTLSVTFLLLSSGIHLKNISFDSVRINKLYIKWNEKLNIHIKQIDILQNKSSSNGNLIEDGFFSLLGTSQIFLKLTESITIENITKGDLKGRFIYKNNFGHLNISSKSDVIDTHIYSGDRYTTIELSKYYDSNKSIKLNGYAILDAKHRSLYISSQIDVGKDVSVNIYAKSDSKRLDYAINSNKDIPSTSFLVSTLNIDPRVVYWVDTAIKMDALQLKQAYGFIEYDKMDEALTNFYAYAKADGLKYTYDQKLDSIQTQYTDLFFKDGVLFILPNNSKTYGMDLDASWLRIDFTKPQEILTLHLLFEGMINKDLKNLLEHYKIKLPFIQNSGYMDTNYLLAINLIDVQIDAKGEFYTDKANFTYLGLDLDLSDTLIKLDNLDAKISKMSAKYKDIAKADVYANLDLKNGTGLIDFDFKEISFANSLTLNTQKNHLDVEYVISPNQDKINIAKSTWNINEQKINLDKISIPFNYEKLLAKIPTTELTSENTLISYLSGKIDFKKLKVDMELDVVKFNQNNIKLDQSVASLTGVYQDNKLSFRSKQPLNLEASEQDITIDELNLAYNEGSVHVKSNKVEVHNLLKTGINLSYSLEHQNGYLRLNKLNFQNDTLGKLFNKYNNIDFNIHSTNNQFSITDSTLDISAYISPQQWNLTFNSLDKVKHYSQFLEKYQVDKGNFSIYKKQDDKNIKFLANIKYKYDLLHIDDKPVPTYIIKGEIADKNTLLSVNDKVDVDFSDGLISISGSEVGVDINNIVKIINETNQYSKDSSDVRVGVSLNNSYIFLSDTRRVLADTLELQYLNKITSAQIKYADGEAGFKYKDRNFHLYGSDFGDIFMENLFAMSKFKGGKLNFSIQGNLDEFDGVAFVKDTTIKRFRLLNNVLAFVNTIPSLVTFSLPSYNTKGLYAKTAYMRFSYANNLYDISDVYLESEELSILGHGKTSLKDNLIDMELNLKTDLASAVSKIPVVGYILFDKDSISTSIEIKGKLDDPEINSMLAKEIIVAPLNIIKRTLLLPFTPFFD